MFKNKVCEVVSRHELLWFGKPPNVTQLEDSDEAIAAAVRERQADAYAYLESLVQQMETILQQIASWSNISGFGPADRQISLARLPQLKDAAPSTSKWRWSRSSRPTMITQRLCSRR